MKFKYSGVVSQQMPDSPQIVLFSAPAVEIAQWAGIPQRRRIDHGDGVETAGFQREEKPTRVSELSKFMADHRNVIQNPLLTATQEDGAVAVVDLGEDRCFVEISEVDLSELTLHDLLARARAGLVARIPSLKERQPRPKLQAQLRQSLSLASLDSGNSALDQDAYDDSEEENGPVDDPAAGLFQEETQVVDFYDEINSRLAVLEELGESGNTLDEIGGFSRDYVESLAKPIVLVDGQHRLKGALQAVDDFIESTEGRDQLQHLVDSGHSPEEATALVRKSASRSLPVSLLATSDPSEHVFQFVVVNQKATPMSNALLGTIVSTSLSQDELQPIADRLSTAGIKLESSRAVAYLSRSPESPFRGLVATGVRGDQSGALPWSVLVSLANMVRELDGKTFHPPRVNSIRTWRRLHLPKTGLIPAEIDNEEARIRFWSQPDGPWRKLFIELHKSIRDKFGDTVDMKSHNAWGVTRSNLFNMVSLSILTVDYFAFLKETQRSLDDWEDVTQSIGDWIGDLNPQYFNRDWRMSKTKKDQTAIKEAWSAAWFGYRTDSERMPRVEVYNPGGSR
ncbi:hypothetical protein GS434_11860 [Rhodococcus hoagii]|nr:hypothetical protein [Prescottella equi]